MVMQTTDTLLKLDATQSNTFGSRDKGIATGDTKDSFKNTFEKERVSSAKADKHDRASAGSEASSQQAKTEHPKQDGGQREANGSSTAKSSQPSTHGAEHNNQESGEAHSNSQQAFVESSDTVQADAQPVLTGSQVEEAAVQGVLAAFGLGPISAAGESSQNIGEGGDSVLVASTATGLTASSSAISGFNQMPASAIDESLIKENTNITSLNANNTQPLSQNAGLAAATGLASSLKNGTSGGQPDDTGTAFNHRPLAAFIAREQGAQPITVGAAQAANAGLNTLEQQLNMGQNNTESLKPSSLSFSESLLATSSKAPAEAHLAAVAGGSEHGSLLSSPAVASAGQARLVMPATISFGQPQWAGMVAERAASMALQNIQFAELQLDPADLGPVHIKVSTHQDQATVVFTSANQQVREALDQSLTKLREMMAEEGMDLVDASVSDQGAYDQQESNSSDEEGAEQPTLSEVEKQESEAQLRDQNVTNINATYGVDSYA